MNTNRGNENRQSKIENRKSRILVIEDNEQNIYLTTFLLEKHGYDQIPTGSNWTEPGNFLKTVQYCRRRVSPQKLKGFMQTVWKPTVEARRHRHFEAAEEIRRAVAGWAHE